MLTTDTHPPTPQFGLNLNNREPLLTADYGLGDLLDLAVRAEELGLASAWVGDSLFSKPRYEALALLGALAQRTRRLRLGTACLVTPTRDPLYLALTWATLDHLSGGRMTMGACMGSPEEGVRREFAAVGRRYEQRAAIFEESLAVLRSLLREGRVTFKGEHYDYDGIAFESGTEPAPLRALQERPPVWVVSNPGIASGAATDATRRRMHRAARRILTLGDGWMTCCRADHPDELVQQRAYLHDVAAELDVDLTGFEIAYQVTLNVGETRERAQAAMRHYIDEYYPELGAKVALPDWGPAGTADDVAAWLRRFAELGVTHFICRFADLDQFGQLERFAQDVLPLVQQPREAPRPTPSTAAELPSPLRAV